MDGRHPGRISRLVSETERQRHEPWTSRYIPRCPCMNTDGETGGVCVRVMVYTRRDPLRRPPIKSRLIASWRDCDRSIRINVSRWRPVGRLRRQFFPAFIYSTRSRVTSTIIRPQGAYPRAIKDLYLQNCYDNLYSPISGRATKLSTQPEKKKQ